MIVICSGDSFTHGMELWEEMNIPNYATAKTHEEGLSLVKIFFTINNIGFENIEDHARNLTYSGTIKNLLSCKVVNIGKGGSSQQETAQLTISTLTKLKKENPNETIICIMQDTSPDRIWIKNKDNLKSYVLPSIEKYYDNKIEAYEIKDIYMRYSTLEQMHLDYYMQSAMVQRFCLNNDIKFMHFIMWNNQHRTTESNIDMLYIHDLFFDDRHCIPVAMIYKLEDHYNNKDFYLPGLHVNCESHKLLGEWIVEGMKERNII